MFAINNNCDTHRVEDITIYIYPRKKECDIGWNDCKGN